MKHYLIACALLLTLSATASGVQPRHRHHQPVEVVDTTATDELEAYSDTTDAGLAGAEDTTYASQADDDSSYSPIFKGDGFLRSLTSGTLGVGAVLIAIVVILSLLLIALAPFILIVLVLRYLVKRNNERATLVQKSMENGQPLPEEYLRQTDESPEAYWRRGVKNVAIGLGMTMMFGVWDADMLVGAGLFVAAWGVGQIIIAKKSK